jgi:3-dehydrosphinganine reductase
MELRPFDVLVSVVYPPDTDTPGLKREMEGKPEETIMISDKAGTFTSEEVAKGIIEGCKRGIYTITIGLDGWMLGHLCAGMAPAPVLHNLII